MNDTRADIARGVLAVLFIVALIGSSIWILRPFLGAMVWAATIVVATWPLMIALQSKLWGKRPLAVTLMTLLLLCVLVVPLTLAIGAIVSNADEIVAWAKSLAEIQPPARPEWLANLPLVGAKAVELWESIAAAGVQGVTAKAAPYVGIFIGWLVAQLGNVGVLLLQFLLTVILAAAMYANGERAAQRLVRFGRRLAGAGGENAVYLAGQTIRGVALGIVVTALAQSLFGGLGLMIAGVPFASALTGAMDNFLRPILIKRGADLPLLLIFAGVVGGLLAFGLIGIFVGPVVLAVADALLTAWINGDSGESDTTE
ncbi:MAG: AI-2E family transporter [Candidatus Binatia bacterium]